MKTCVLDKLHAVTGYSTADREFSNSESTPHRNTQNKVLYCLMNTNAQEPSLARPQKQWLCVCRLQLLWLTNWGRKNTENFTQLKQCRFSESYITIAFSEKYVQCVSAFQIIRLQDKLIHKYAVILHKVQSIRANKRKSMTMPRASGKDIHSTMWLCSFVKVDKIETKSQKHKIELIQLSK